MTARASLWSALLALLLGGAGCGTLAHGGPEETQADRLPVSGAGPYRELPSPSPLLDDATASLDDPLLLADGEALSLWFTRRLADRTDIARAVFASIGDEAPVVSAVLAAEAPWEGGSVSQPALLPLGDGTILLCYATATGAIGCALGDGAAGWRRAEAPALSPDPMSGDGLGSPALLALDGRTVRLVHLAGGVLRAADATVDALVALAPSPFVITAAALVAPGAAPWLPAIGRTTARTVMTATGRRRHELLLTGRVGGARVVGFAGSFDGTVFSFGEAPLLPAAAPEEWAPTIAAWRGGALLVHAATAGRRTVLLAAAQP